MSGGGSSGKNYYGFGKGKGGRKGDPIIWEGPLGPDSFPEPVFEFPPQHKSEFTNETPLRQYDNRREPWPKCRHGEDCLVQMCTDGMDGGRRFFKCPHAWVILGCFISLSSMRHLTWNLFCSLPMLQKTVVLLGGSILHQLILFRSSSSTSRLRYLIWSAR